MTIITRFAPSPTGYLHIGGARTALFNWLYAKHTGGKFLLRIEDTDKERSTADATRAIIEGMKWLGLEHDGEIVMQSECAARHAEVAHELVALGKAYLCYCSPAELEAMREQARVAGKPIRSPWRDKNSADAPTDIKPTIRIKAPLTGEVVIDDAVQGTVRVAAEQLDDFIILRSDGSPTYMHAVVVDDHDMGITHVIRGDDHLNNAFRQWIIYDAMGWDIPVFAHIPLIHGADGAKLSKRHGALGVEDYRDMGYLPEAICNYLLRLGWSHGDDEIISRDQAIEWFDIKDVNKGASRMDFDKLANLNGHYIREAKNSVLLQNALNRLNSNPLQEAMDRLNSNPLQEVMDRLNSNPLQEVMDRLNSNPLQEAMDRLNSNPLQEAMDRLNSNPLQEAMDRLNSNPLQEAMDRLNSNPLQEAMDRLNSNPLQEAIDKLNESDPLLKMVESLKPRAKTILELAESARFYFEHLSPQDDKAQQQLNDGLALMKGFIPQLEAVADWSHDPLFALAKDYAENSGVKIGALMAPIRVAITGSTASPSMFEVMEILGKDESLRRLKSYS